MVGALLILEGALLLAAPWASLRAETAPPSSATQDDCDPSRPESIACGTYFFNVAGRVVFAGPGGDLVPVRGAKFFEVENPTRDAKTQPRELQVKITRSGEFRFRAFVPTSSRSKPCPDGRVQTRHIYLPTYLLLRANGCDDLTIRVEKNWNPGTIVLQCPRQP